MTNEDKNFDLALTWDSEERLETLFYEDFMDIPSKYHVRYDYNLSGNDRLGVLQENRLYSDGSQTTIGKAFSANGLPLAQIARVDNSYSVRGLLKSHTTDQRTETYAMRKDPLNLELLRMEALMGDSMKLGSSENDSFSFLLESWKTFEDGVSGNNAQVVTLEDGFLKVSEFRQSELSQVKWYDSAMRMKRMQLGQKLDYRFNYDWHGRFQSIAMPDGSFLSIAYDEFGRKKSVQHSKLGSREFLYKKQTGLLDQILVKGAQGKKQRSTAFKYDEKARVIGRIHQVDGKSKAFSLSYDGNMGFGARKNHQLGFQTGERSDDYAKNVIHSVDGKVIRQEQAYGDSMLLSQSFEQDWDGFVKSRNIELKDLNGPSLFSYRLSQSRDSLGRLKYVYLDQKLLLTFEYDDLGRVDKVIDSSGRVTSLRYDQLTKGMKGWDSVVGQQKIDYEWHYDERGLIASESFVTYEQAVAKAYSYDEAEFLINEVSQLDTRAYAYDYDLRQERRDLALDDFGYRTSAKGLSLSYGADGHLESSVGPAGLFRYVHDADGQRIARFKNGKLDMIFADDLVIREGKIFQRLKVQGILLGIIEQGQFRPVYTDSRGTPFFAGQEGLKVSGAYGETMLEADQDVLNYAGFGKDKELGWVRFGVRDYDPASGLFTSPDSLFLENPELCVESPVECNLYSYAKNNPLKYTDPAGQAAFLAIVPIIGYVASEFFDTDTAHAPGRNDQPQSTTTGFNQDQQRVLDRGVDFLGKAIDKVVPGPNVIGPTMKMAREAHQQSGNQTGSKLKPNLEATGPHTTFSRDQNGNVYKYETYDIQPKGHWEPLKRFDGGKPDGNPGATHRNSLTGESIPTPHTQSKYIEGGVEYATPREIPDNARFNNGR